LLVTFHRQQSGETESRLAAIDELFLAVGDRLGRVLGRAQIERLTVFDMRGDPTDAEPEALAQHRQRDRAAHDRPGFTRTRFSAVIVVADLDRGDAGAERDFEAV